MARIDAPAAPGPKRHPIFGNRIPHQDILGFMERTAAEFGEIASLRFFHVPACVVTSPALFEEVLVKQHSKMRKPWDLQQLRVALGDGLLTSEGALWRRQRRLIQPTFHRSLLDGYGDIMVARTRRMLESWAHGSERDVNADMVRLTLEIVFDALFGVDIGPAADRIEHALGLTVDTFEKMIGSAIPLGMNIPTPANMRMRRAIAGLDESIYALIELRKQKYAEAPDAACRDLLGGLIAARDEDGSVMDDQLIRDEAITMILAGHETTAIALSWTLMLLSQHPDITSQLHDELERVLGGRAPTSSDLSELRYTRSVIEESMRLYPPAWAVGRETTEEIDLGGYRVRNKSQIFLLSILVHRDPRYFDDPLVFRPERWTDEARAKIPKFAYLPFGGGARKCIGMHFAMMEAILVLATIAQSHALTWLPQDIELQATVTLRPRNGVRLGLSNRVN